MVTGKELVDSIYQGAIHDTPIIDPDDLIGYTFVKDYHGTPQRAEVKEKLDENGNFLIEFVNGGEDLMNYNDLINIFNAHDQDGEKLWTYDKILDHRRVKGEQYEVKVLWDTGDVTWEPMKVLKEDDKITLASYARERGLLDEPGWKWARRFTKNPKKFIRMAKIFASQTRNHGTKYKYGIKVPKDYKEAVRFDKEKAIPSGRMLLGKKWVKSMISGISGHSQGEPRHLKGTKGSQCTSALISSLTSGERPD